MMQISDCFEAVSKSQVHSTVPFEKIEVCVSVHKLNHCEEFCDNLQGKLYNKINKWRHEALHLVTS